MQLQGLEVVPTPERVHSSSNSYSQAQAFVRKSLSNHKSPRSSQSFSDCSGNWRGIQFVSFKPLRNLAKVWKVPQVRHLLLLHLQQDPKARLAHLQSHHQASGSLSTLLLFREHPSHTGGPCKTSLAGRTKNCAFLYFMPSSPWWYFLSSKIPALDHYPRKVQYLLQGQTFPPHSQSTL